MTLITHISGKDFDTLCAIFCEYAHCDSWVVPQWPADIRLALKYLKETT